MKILAINASHRGRRGHTAYLIDRLFTGARATGAECEEVTLASLELRRCVACDRCQKVEPRFQCVFDGKDDVHEVFQRIAGADLVVWASPVYVFGLSSLLRTLLERFYGTADCADLRVSDGGLMFHAVDPALCSKPFVSLVCCDNIEDATPRNAREFFHVFSRFMDAPQVGELVRNGGGICRFQEPPHPPRVAAVYQAYEEAGRELATSGRISRGTQRRANREVVPMPLFAWLKRLPSSRMRRQFVARAKAMRPG